MPANCIFDGPITNLTLNTVHFGRNLFGADAKGAKNPEWFQIWHFY